jgi:hypothetical protein
MSPVITEYSILSESNQNLYKVSDIQEIGDITLIGRRVTKNSQIQYKLSKEDAIYYPLLEISTPIAMFTTAYARMLMADYKIKYANNLYYSDTDSLILDCPLPGDMVGKELGQFKLEYKVKEGVFLGPKVYALRVEGIPDIIKVKGLKNPNTKVSFEDLKELLLKDSALKLKQDKWFRSLDNSGIQILNSLYTLRATDNKRSFIYKDEVAVNTKPFVI